MPPSGDRRLSRSELLGKGAAPLLFSFALKGINSEVMRRVKQGRKKYFTKDDALWAWEKYQGECAYCGYFLKPHGRGKAQNSLYFMMYCPFEGGGQVIKENLLPVCVRCRRGQKPISRRCIRRAEGYNTLADMIVLLLEAVLYGETALIPLLKREVNHALDEYVMTLRVNPVKSEKKESARLVLEGENTLADLIERNAGAVRGEAWNDLSALFRAIRLTKRAQAVRNDY